MVANRRRDTEPELAIRRRVHAAGLRYRVDAKPLPELNRRADLVFRPARIAVLIHGCFWHGCPVHYVEPRANRVFWSAKIERTRIRDLETSDRLIREGWEVVTIWEHEDPDLRAQHVIDRVRLRLRTVPRH
jgi:DNA mismatch endonuclease, patch repair protein